MVSVDGGYRPSAVKLEQTTIILRDIPKETPSDVIVGLFRK
jgi:hypothetical protein